MRPGGRGWAAIAHDIEGFEADALPPGTLLGMAGGGVAVYGVLLGVGELLLGSTGLGVVYLGLGAAGTGLMLRSLAAIAQQSLSNAQEHKFP